jgi:hypothetical protein
MLLAFPSLSPMKQVLHIIRVNVTGWRIYSSPFLSLEAYVSYVGGEEWPLSSLLNNLASTQDSKKKKNETSLKPITICYNYNRLVEVQAAILLEYGTMSLGDCYLTFWHNMVVTSSRII